LTPGLFGSVASAPFAPAFAFFLFFLEMGSSVPVSPKRWSSIGRNISPGGAGLYHGWWKVSRPVVRYARRSALSRHSVIDVGSNTIHLLVGEVDGGEVLPVTGEKVSARLGAGVERKGRIEAERLELAAEAIGLFARIAALNGAPGPTILATSAVRDAENGEELTERVRELSGLKMRLISGEEEAALGFRGAVSAVGTSWEGPALVVDLGGERTAHAGLAAARLQPHHGAVRGARPAEEEAVALPRRARQEDDAGVGDLAAGLGRGGRRVGEGHAQDHARQADGRADA
jgi:hypothetical protein